MSFQKYQNMTAQAVRLVRRNLTPWRSLNEATDTYQRQCRHVATLVDWLRAEWQEQEVFDDAEITAEAVWELSGELFRMKRQLILVFAKVSDRNPREVVETLMEMEASSHHLSPPTSPQEEAEEED